MRKTLTLLGVFILTTTLAFAQGFGGEQGFGSGKAYDPVKWSGEVEKISDTEYILHYDAKIQNKWHIYSQFTPEDGPIPMRFKFLPENGTTYELDGKAEESATIREYSDIFGVDEVFWKDTARISQKIILKDNTIKLIKSEVKYQSCIEDGVCINQEFYFVHDLSQEKTISFSNYKAFEDYTAVVNTTEKDTIDEEDSEDDKGLLSIFLIAFISGFAVLLTPCVFPMIPMTVSFFTKQSKDRASGIKNAVIYGISIIVIYTVLGTVISILFGSNFMYELSTGPIFNFIFFVIILVFAISFLGAFEIMLPNSLVNKVDSQANRGGYVGIFFMALALAIVSFSCTFPIAGTALVDAATKGGIAPIISMLGFSLAIALPFTLFAIFPGWLNSLPKSGGWLNSVKVFLGFLELAFAFKFLSNVDLVLDWHFLSREVFIAIWIAIFGSLALYLFGKIKLPHDSDLKHISVGRLLLGLTTLAFTISLIPGLWGAPLQLISGFPPPQHSHSESPFGVGYTNSTTSTTNGDLLPEGASYGPHKIISFKDYETGLAYAKKVNKTAMIDFTGVTCQNCRKMEERVWVEPTILNMLNQDIVLISLYADDPKDLPKSEQYVSDVTGNRVKTYGQKWLEFQQVTYGTNAQPYYVLIDHDGSSLNKPVAYTPDIEEYEAWLKEGITRFNNN